MFDEIDIRHTLVNSSNFYLSKVQFSDIESLGSIGFGDGKGDPPPNFVFDKLMWVPQLLRLGELKFV